MQPLVPVWRPPDVSLNGNGHSAFNSPSLAPPPMMYEGVAIPTPVRVPEVQVQKRFGVVAEIRHEGQDAEILTMMSQAATLLHALAAKMNAFQLTSDGTRKVIRACRNLATDLQEEIEVRLGPQGPNNS